MSKIHIEIDLLGKSMDTFNGVGIVLASLEIADKQYILETNGEKDDLYLELVEYELGLSGSYTDIAFSEPIWEVPNSVEEVESIFDDWLKL